MSHRRSRLWSTHAGRCARSTRRRVAAGLSTRDACERISASHQRATSFRTSETSSFTLTPQRSSRGCDGARTKVSTVSSCSPRVLLQRWDRWSRLAKDYLANQPDDVSLEPLIRSYTTRVTAFYVWLDRWNH